MPFGDISLPPGAFQQPNIAGSFLDGALGMQRMQTSQALADDLEREAALKQRVLDAENQWNAAVKANPGEQGLAALYAANPDRAMDYEKKMRELEKIRGEVGKVNAETQVKQGEWTEKQRAIIMGEAVGAKHYLNALPPERRTIDALKPYLTDRSAFYAKMGDSTIASGLLDTLKNPDALTHIEAAARAGGYKDPDEDMRRDIYKSTEIERAKNALPPSPYQQQQLAMQGQQLTQARQQQLTEQQRSDARWLIDKYDTAPEVLTYKRVLPKANAVMAAIKSTDPQSDVDIIYGLTNILDDLGSVREGDVGTIKGASSYAQWVDNLQSELKAEGKLGPKARAGIANIIGRRIKEYESSYQAHKSNLDALAQKAGLNPAEVFAEPMAFAGPAQAQPAAPSGPNDVVGRARKALAENPQLRPRIEEWARKHGVDPSQL